MKYKPIAVGGKDKRNIERDCVVECLLNTVTHGAIVVFGLDDRDWDVRLVVENIIGPFCFPTCYELASHDDPTFGEADLFSDLVHLIPAGLTESGRYELRADVALAEILLIHANNCCCQSPVTPFRELVTRKSTRL